MKNADLPAFISVGGPRGGAGFLGMKYAPFNVQNPGTPPENVQSRRSMTPAPPAAPPSSTGSKAASRPNVPMDAARAHKEVYEKALNLVVSTPQGSLQPREGDRRQADRRQAEGRVRHRRLRPRLPARPQAGRGRHRLRPDHPRRLGHAQQHPRLAPAPNMTAGARQGDGHAGEGPGPARQAEGHGDRVDGRLRPHAADQPERRPRPLEPRAGRWCSAAATSRAAWSTAAPTRTAPASPRTRSTSLDLYGTLYRGLGIDPTPETNASVRDNLGRPYYIAGEKPNEKTGSYWIKELVS